MSIEDSKKRLGKLSLGIYFVDWAIRMMKRQIIENAKYAIKNLPNLNSHQFFSLDIFHIFYLYHGYPPLHFFHLLNSSIFTFKHISSIIMSISHPNFSTDHQHHLLETSDPYEDSKHSPLIDTLVEGAVILLIAALINLTFWALVRFGVDSTNPSPAVA